MQAATQPSLFDTAALLDTKEVAAARLRMRATIERLTATTNPDWRNQSAVILEDGAFQRAMSLVPEPEAGTLWASFDAQMTRLYAIWAASHPSSDTL